MAHACNARTLGGQGRWIMRSGNGDHPDQHGETLSLLKYKKISQAWWRTPVVPATQEAEAGESLEHRRSRLQWAEITLLRSSLGNKIKTPSPKKKKCWSQFHMDIQVEWQNLKVVYERSLTPNVTGVQLLLLCDKDGLHEEEQVDNKHECKLRCHSHENSVR